MSREATKAIGQQISHQRQKMRGNSVNQTSGIFEKNTKNEQFLLFNFIAYPFANQRRITFKGLKTVLKAEQIKGSLERLVSLNHQNIIQIERVAKSNVKTHPQSKPETYYSIYYEFVPFSLRKIAQATKAESALLPDLNAADLCNKLVDVLEYLMELDIYLLLRLEDIGLTQDGQVKVYASPVAITKQKDKNKVSKREVIANVDRILGWCRTAIASRGRKPSRKSEDGPISNSLGFDTDSKDVQQPKISTSFIEKSNRQHYDNNQPEKDLKQTSSTPEKVRRLEDEVRQIKAIMAQKIKGHMQMNSEHPAYQGSNSRNRQPGSITRELLTKNRQLKANESIAEDQIGSTKKQTSTNQQSFQQNINCINIYNNLQLKQSQERIKNLQTQQIYSFKIESNKLDPAPKNYNRIIHLNTFPQDFHPLEDEDQNLSIDTYEMDLGEEFEPRVQDGLQPFRMSLKSPKRDNSERRYNPNADQTSNNAKATTNQVVATKKVTESAGPLQFKHFILQHIKPQFLAKKSNIYEDPGEYDSEKSYSLSKKASNYIKELTEAGKSAASYHQKSSSAKRSKENQVQSFSKKKNKQVEQRLKGSQDPRPVERGLEPSRNVQQQELKRFIKNQRSEAVITSKVEEVNINDKVKAALEKTRNAIALLNRVKASKNTHPAK